MIYGIDHNHNYFSPFLKHHPSEIMVDFYDFLSLDVSKFEHEIDNLRTNNINTTFSEKNKFTELYVFLRNKNFIDKYLNIRPKNENNYIRREPIRISNEFMVIIRDELLQINVDKRIDRIKSYEDRIQRIIFMRSLGGGVTITEDNVRYVDMDALLQRMRAVLYILELDGVD